MKRLSVLVAILLVFTLVQAQKKVQRAPLSQDYIDYVKKYDKTTVKKSAEGYSLGYIPSPFQINFNTSGIISESKKSMQELPSQFDLRVLGYVTSVKDQNPLGSCWTFSSIGAIESSWLMKGYSNIDLSEENMGTCHGFEVGINDGGNDMIASAYLTRLDGPVAEASDPYSKDPDATCPPEVLPKPAYVPTVTWLPKDVNTIKKALYEYGAVSASIFSGSPLIYKYFSPTDYTFYYNGTESPDHAVLVVGWDDDMDVKGGFNSPQGTKGAWIVKNSWGSDWGDDGYFYVSYKDTRFLSTASVFPEKVDIADIDTMYMEDKLGATTSFGFRSETGYGLVKFEAPYEQFINKIGTFINSSGTVIDIEVYDNLQGDTLLTDLISSSYGKIVKYPGFHTFDIPALVNGDFYIKVKYVSSGYNYPIPVETAISLAGHAYAAPEINPKGTFWISEDGEKWEALGNNIENMEADLCIRAYTERNTDLNVYYTADNTLTCVGSDIVFTDNTNGDANDYSWNFGAGASPSTANTKGPHTVSYSTPGFKNIILEVTGNSGTESLNKKAYVEVVENLDVFLPYSEILLVEGKSVSLTAFGAEDYSWSPSEGLNETEGNPVIASPLDTTTYTVEGSLGNCTGSATVTINIVENPPNDDVCEALEISLGEMQGEFTNVYATVEDGEPFAPEGECDEPMHWCVEGGLQNSVWFTFLGPESGVISIQVPGMDNQVALYKADHCDSLFSPTGFEMVAAFDDYFSEEEFFAAALEDVTVTPGQRYYLQVDGSAGGAEGIFSLIFWNHPLSSEDYKQSIDSFNKLKIYPNPGDGIFNISLQTLEQNEVKIEVYDATGRILYIEEYDNSPDYVHSINLEKLKAGNYFLNFVYGNETLSRYIIIQ